MEINNIGHNKRTNTCHEFCLFTSRRLLENGTLEKYYITYPIHYVFDIRNGKISDSTVWATDLESYEIKQETKLETFF